MGANRDSIVVIGPVSLIGHATGTSTKLTPTQRRAIAALVATEQQGLTIADWFNQKTTITSNDESTFRMALMRVRKVLPPGAIVDMGSGRHRLEDKLVEVDVWRLLALSNSTEPIDLIGHAELAQLLRPVLAFDGVKDLLVADDMAPRIRQAQHELLVRVANERPELLRGGFIDELRTFFEDDPFNENLLQLLLQAEAEAGNRRQALETFARAKRRFIDVGLTLSAQFDLVEQALLNGEEHSRVPAFIEQQRRPIPEPLAELLSRPHVGHSAELKALIELLEREERRVAGAVIDGPPGAGKTRLCAALAAAAYDIAIPTLYLRPPRNDEQTGYAGLMAALPSFRERAAQITADNRPDSQAIAFLEAAVTAIENVATGGSVLVIVDDSQWLDSPCSALLAQLFQTGIEARMILVVVETKHDARQGWEPLSMTVAGNQQSKHLSLEPLSASDLVELVELTYPGMDRRLARSVGNELRVTTGGLPGIASIVLAASDRDRMTIDLDLLRRDLYLEAVVAQLAPDVQRVGAIASVIGLDIDLDALQHIADMAMEELLEALDTLVGHGLVRDISYNEYGIAHLLVQEALLGSQRHHHLARWHAGAADYFHDDVHRRARHQVFASSAGFLPEAKALASLLESASMYLRGGLYREAVNQYRLAEVVGSGPLDPGYDGCFARALDLSGMPVEARRVRSRGLQKALTADDHVMALQIITSGLPESEPVDGDQALVDGLRSIDTQRLDRTTAYLHACHLARQLAITGKLAEAELWADRASAMSEGPTERVEAAITIRFVRSATAPAAERIAILDRVADDVRDLDPDRRADYYMFRAIDHYENAQLGEAKRCRAELDSIELVPQRRWHAMLFDAMVCFDDGDFASAAEMRGAAYEYALRSGITEAGTARVGGDFIGIWLAGQEAARIGYVSDEVQTRSVAVQAGIASIWYAAGQTGDPGRTGLAVALAESLTKTVVNSPLSQGTAAIAIASRVLAASHDTELIGKARDLLAGRGHSMLMVAACAASLGPVERYVAILTDDVEERRRLLRSAVALADDSGSVVWQVVTRRDLLALGETERHSEIIDLTNSSAHDLNQLLLDER